MQDARAGFMRLCQLIEPEVIEISKFAPDHHGVMSVELALHRTICWLSGEIFGNQLPMN